MALILIIDDEPSILMLLKRILAASGHELITASEGSTGLQLARERDVHLILSDLSMPGQPSGLELLAEIRRAKPACPLAVVTGYSSPDCIEDCRRLGITDFLPKPFEIPFVRAFVAEMLQRPRPGA